MPQTKWKYGVLVGTLLIGVSLLLRGPGLFESLWFDEVYRTFQVMQPENILDLLLHDVHNPLYNALMYGWIRVFGDSEISIRMPSMIAGYAMVWVLWRWARERFGERVAGIAAAWLLISPVPVWYFGEAKNSIFTALFGTLVLVAHDRMAADEERQWGRVGACVAASVLAVLTDFQTMLVIIPVWIAVMMEVRRRREEGRRALKSRLFVVVLVTAMLVAPLLVFKAAHVTELARDYLGLFNLKSMLWFLCLWMPIGTVLPNAPAGWWPAEVAVTGVVLLPLMGMGIWALRRSAPGRLVAWAFVFPLGFYLVASAVLHAMGDRQRLYQDRNIIVLLPWYPLVIAAGIEAVREPLKKYAAGLVLGGGLVASVLICTVLAGRWTVMTPNPDWRTAGRIIDKAPGKAVVISRTALLPLRYYSADSVQVETVKGGPPTEEIGRALREHPCPKEASEFFLISDPWWAPMSEAERAELDQRYPLVERIELRSLTLERRRAGGVAVGDVGGGGERGGGE